MSSTRKSPRVRTRVGTQTTVTTTAHVPTTVTVRAVSATIARARPTTTTASRSKATNRNLRPSTRSATSAAAVQRPLGSTSRLTSTTARKVSVQPRRLATATATATAVSNAIEENQPITTQNVSTCTSPLIDTTGNMVHIITPFNENAQNIMTRITSHRSVVSCPVCFMTNLENNLYTMSCGHIFCHNCIMQATICYICRAVVKKSSIHILYI